MALNAFGRLIFATIRQSVGLKGLNSFLLFCVAVRRLTSTTTTTDPAGPPNQGSDNDEFQFPTLTFGASRVRFTNFMITLITYLITNTVNTDDDDNDDDYNAENEIITIIYIAHCRRTFSLQRPSKAISAKDVVIIMSVIILIMTMTRNSSGDETPERHIALF